MACVYCGSGKATREHVWSQGVLQLFEPVANLTIDPGRQLVHRSEPVVKDVCKRCNNGTSPADAIAIRFVEQWLLVEIPDGSIVATNGALLERWAAKTAANQERQASNGGQWWKPHSEYLRGVGGKPEAITVWFAPWRDSSPINGFGVVNELMAREAVFVKCASMSPADANGCFNRGWALKVGWGVFLVFDQKPNIRERVIPLWNELRRWGWGPVADEMAVVGSSFNVWTSPNFQLLGPPDITADQLIGGLRSLRA